MEKNEENIVQDEVKVKRDESFDIASLITTTEPLTSPKEVVVKPVKKMSPLDMAIANDRPTGFDAGENDITDEPKVLRNSFQSYEREDEFNKSIADRKELIEKEKLVYVLHKPTNGPESAELIGEIESVSVDPETGRTIIPEGARWIVAKDAVQEHLEKEESDPERIGEAEVLSENNAKIAKKMNLVKILVDKTGLGANISFDKDEKAAILTADEIHVVEVENKDLEFVEFERGDNMMPFMEAVDAYQLSVSRVPVTFAASGFKADMTGLTYGEFSDITLDVRNDDEYLDFDKINKKLSIIYKRMQNVSTGAFKDYEDFLKNFAYLDVAIGTYGLLIATEPEVDTIGLVCNNKDCERGFNHSYIPRELIDWDSASTYYLEQIKKINLCKPEDRIKVMKEAPLHSIRRYKLDDSGYLVDIGAASCADYLYNILGLVQELTDKKVPEDAPEWDLVALLNAVRGIIIPRTSGGKPIRYSNARDLVDIMSNYVSARDIEILKSLYSGYIRQLSVGFSIKNIVCPHCKTKTEELDVLPDELVFRIHQRQRGTGVILDNFQNF